MEFEEYISIVNAWLKDLSVSVDEELQLDDEGICCCRIEEDTIITIEVSNEFPILHLYSSVFPLPDQKAEERIEVLTKILEMNAFQKLTRGGALALVPGGNLIIYCFSLPIENTNSASFDKILGEFYSTAQMIKENLNEFEKKKDISEYRIKA